MCDGVDTGMPESEFAKRVRAAVLDLIGAERDFQIENRGYDWLVDIKKHTPDTLAAAAAYFAVGPGVMSEDEHRKLFEFSGLGAEHDKYAEYAPHKRRAVAAALMMAAIERGYIETNWGL